MDILDQASYPDKPRPPDPGSGYRLIVGEQETGALIESDSSSGWRVRGGPAGELTGIRAHQITLRRQESIIEVAGIICRRPSKRGTCSTVKPRGRNSRANGFANLDVRPIERGDGECPFMANFMVPGA